MIRTLAVVTLAACSSNEAPPVEDASPADAAVSPRADANTPPTDAAPFVDLAVAAKLMDVPPWFRDFTFAPEDPEVREGCTETGRRRLLAFTVAVSNVGTAALDLGEAGPNDPRFSWSPAHGHYHVVDFATYRLLDRAGVVVVAAHKQAFCLRDSSRVRPDAGRRRFDDCVVQGISPGWADVYPANLPCQWLDVTDVAPGAYVLEVEVDPSRRYAEGSVEDDVWRRDVVLPPKE